MAALQEGFVRRTVRGVGVSNTRSCTVQSSGTLISSGAAIPVPFAPVQPLRGRAGILLKYGLSPGFVVSGFVWVQGDRIPGGLGPPGPATALSYPIIGEGGNTARSRRVDRVTLTLTGNVPLFVTHGPEEALGTLEVE